MRNKLALDRYPFLVRPLSTEEDGGYLVEFPNFPGVISDGETPEEAIRNRRDALAAALMTMREFGDAIAKPGAGHVGQRPVRGSAYLDRCTLGWWPVRSRKG